MGEQLYKHSCNWSYSLGACRYREWMRARVREPWDGSALCTEHPACEGLTL